MDDNNFDKSEMKILLVDDTPANIDVLKHALQSEGYKLSFAPNGKVALKLADHNVPDLILLDIMMPEMDGLETCSHLKSNEKTKDIPIIFITAKTETEDVVKGFQLGGVDYIAKPFHREEVCARVKTHLQLVQAWKMLKSQNKSLEELNKLKNAFVGMAAHDLRNPLSIICMLTQLMIMDKNTLTPEIIEKKLNMIRNSGKRMLSLINNLLDVTAIESGNLKLNIKPGSLKTLVSERIQIFEIGAREKEIQINSTLADIDDFLFDPNYIAQVIDNLITNALKFSESNKNVYVTLGREGPNAKISVRDEGPGISKEDQEKLYGAFQKLTAQPTAGEKSTGLGLAIVKKVIEAHKGEISVESELGAGATFSFTLPTE